MNYDKNAFLAGIAVGRELKGWATERINSNGEITVAVSIGTDAEIVLDYSLTIPTAGYSVGITPFAYISTGEHSADVGTLTPPITGFTTQTLTVSADIDASWQGDSLFSETVNNPVLSGTITATATLEVDE